MYGEWRLVSNTGIVGGALVEIAKEIETIHLNGNRQTCVDGNSAQG